MTGGTGFIGSHLVRALLRHGRPVRALVRPGTDSDWLERLGVEVVPGDVTDADGYGAAAYGAERVFHVAGMVAFLPEMRTLMESVNVGGVKNAVRAARDGGAKTLVVTSSVAAVGGGKGEVDETHPWHGDDRLGYASTKRAGEDLALGAAGKKMRIVAVNPAIVLGPEDPRRSTGGDYLIRAATGRIPVAVNMLQGFVDARDCAEGHILAAEKGRSGERYILCQSSVPMAEFLTLCRTAAGNPGRVWRIPWWFLPPLALLAEWWADRRHEPPKVTREQARMARRQAAFSSAKARKELGWKPRPLTATIRDSVEWFQKDGMLENS